MLKPLGITFLSLCLHLPAIAVHAAAPLLSTEGAPSTDTTVLVVPAAQGAQQLDEARLLLAADRPDEAVAVLQSLLASDPDDLEARYQLGVVLGALGQLDAAIAAHEQVTSAPGVPAALARSAAAALDDLYGRRIDAWIADLERGAVEIGPSLRFGDGLANKGRFLDARRLFEAIVRVAPDNAIARYWLGRVLVTLRQFEEGLAQFERSVELAPDNLALRMELGKSYELAGRIDEARTVYEAVLAGSADPRLTTDARRRMAIFDARAAYEAGDIDAALAIYQRLRAETPDDPRLLELTATALEDLGRYDESDRLFQTMLEQRPADAGLRMRLATTYGRRGDSARAQAFYAEVVRLQPDSDLAELAFERLGLNEAADLLQTDRAREALPIFERILRLLPDARVPLLGKGMALHRLERLDEAEAVYRQVIELTPDNELAWLELGQLYQQTGKHDQAIDAFERVEEFAVTDQQLQLTAVFLNPLYAEKLTQLTAALERGDADIREVVRLGERLVRRGFYQDAARLLNMGLEDVPDHPQLYRWLGRAEFGLGEIDRGVMQLERASQLAAGDTDLLQELAQVYEQTGRLDEAESTWQDIIRRAREETTRTAAERGLGLLRARRLESAGENVAALNEYESLLQRMPDDTGLLLGQGRLLLIMDRDGDAARVFEQAALTAPDNIALLVQVAQLYQAAGRQEQARLSYDEALTINPDHIGARLALGRFHEANGRFDAAFTEYQRALESVTTPSQEAQVADALNSLWSSLIEQGRQGLIGGDLAAAETAFGIMVERRPENPQARFWMSELFRAQGDFTRQAENLALVVAADESNILMKRRLALAYESAGMLAEAEATLLEVIEAFPFDSEIRARLAGIHELRGEPERARAEYIRLLELNPTREWRVRALDALGLEQARALRQSRNFNRALAAAQRVLDDVPGDALVYLEMARIHEQAGRSSEAEAAYRDVLRLAPDDGDARFGLARILAASEREREAVAIYADMANARPPLPRSLEARRELDALLLRFVQQRIGALAGEDRAAVEAELMPLGIEIFGLESYGAARIVFEHLIRVAPDSAETNYWLGLLFAEDKAYSDSIIFMRRSVELDPDNVGYHLGLGRIYLEMDLARQAESTFEQAVMLEPNNPLPRFELAAMYQRRGDAESAREQFVRALERATDRPSVARALAGLGLAEDPDRLDARSLETAAQVFEQSMTMAPLAPQVRLYAGIVYQRLQRFDRAETIYREILSTDPAQIQTALRLAQLFGETGRIDEGIALYDRIIERGGDARLAALATQQQTALYARKAGLLAEALDRGEAEIIEARRLGPILVERGAHDSAVPMLEAATRRAPRDPQLWYFLGRAHVDRGRFEAGLAALERSDQLFPGNLLLRHHLALAYGRAGQPERAIPIFEALSRQGENPQIQREARMTLGMLRAAGFVEAGDFTAALREYDALLEISPDDVSLLSDRGRILVELGRDAEADAMFARVLALAPDNLPIRLRLAGIYRERGDNAGYLEQLSAIMRINPRSPESQQARTLLGFDTAMELVGRGELDDALEIFERIRAAIPHDPLALFQIGETYVRQRRFAEAEMQFQEVIRLVPDYQEAHLSLGRLYETLDRQDSAISAYERVLELGRNTPAGRETQPLLAALYAARIQSMFSEGRDEEALAGLARLLEADPNNVPARTTIASLYMQSSRFEDALRELEIAARIQPDNPRIYVQIGAVLTAMARDLQAAEAYAFAVALDPDEQRAQAQVREIIMSVARYLITQDQPFAAIRHLRSANDHGLGNERTYFMLASLYRQQGRFDESARAFRDAVRFAPDNISMRFNLAELYERSNDLDLALIQYRHIVRVGEPGALIVEESRRRASGLRSRLATFTSQLSYSVTLGDSNIEEQDLSGTGALNTSFSSSLFYNLGTNFRPTPYSSLRLDTGVSYVGNHSTERDILVPRIGVSGNLNFPVHFYSASVHANDIREMISDSFQGRSYNASLSGGLRFTDYRDLLPGWTRRSKSERGEDTMDYVVEPRGAVDAEGDNPRLRRALEESLRRQLLGRAPAQMPEGASRYLVREGDGLREIAAALDFDPRRWEEQWRENPRIVDPALILPGDTVIRFDDDAGPTLLIEGRGDGARLAADLESLAPEQRLEREAMLREGVDEAMAHYRAGVGFMRQGRHADAQDRFMRVLAVVPEDPMTLFNLGIVLERQGRISLAEQSLQRAIAADPALQPARLGLAELYLSARNFPAAAAMLTEYADNRARSDGSDQAVTLARRLADAAIADVIVDLPTPETGSVALAVSAARTLMRLGESAAARAALEALLESWPFSADANALLASLLLEEGLANEAIPYAGLSVELAPEDMNHRLLLAQIYRQAGEYGQAEAVYAEVIELATVREIADAADLDLELTRAERLDSTGNAAGAREIHAGLIAEHPDHVRLLVAAATTAEKLGQLDESIDFLQRAIALEPERFDLRLSLADLYLRQGRSDSANETLAAAHAHATDRQQRRQVLDRLGFGDGIEQIRRGRWGRAMTTMERIQSIVPDEPLVQLNIGVIRQQQRRDLDAESAFQQVLDADPQNLTARLRLGLLYSETGRIDRAISVLERVASEGIGQDAGARAREALEGLEARRLRRLTSGEAEQTAPTMKTLQVRGFWSDSDLPARALTETFSYGVGLSLFFRSLNYGDWILNYTFGTRENEDPLGTDYAYVWNEFGATWRASVRNPFGLFGDSRHIPGLTGTISLTREMRVYTFADTNALNALGRVERRQHDTDTLSLGLAYQPPNHDNINFFLSYNYGQSRANLPVGILFSPDGLPIAFQSRGLGDFDPNYFTAGMAFQF